MFAKLYIFVCGACDYSFHLFLESVCVCVCVLDHILSFGSIDDVIRCPACQSKSTNLYMYIDGFDTFYSCLPRV